MYLGETDGGRLFTEALTADVHPVLANDTTLVAAYSAVGWISEGLGCMGYFLTIDENPSRTCVGERTKRRRGSFWMSESVLRAKRG
jgi:hypothetical protein